MKETKNELNNYQKKVFAEYELIKSLKRSSVRINESREKYRKGCLVAPFSVFADLFVGKILGREKRKRNYTGFAQEARELLRQKKISDKICEMIVEISRKEILTEEKFVNQFTAVLFQSSLASQFIIPENVVLYAMMATEIYNIGLENFCSEQQNNQ